MKAILKKHPDLDFFFAFVGGEQIPTKQDKFKPINDKEIYIKAGGEFKKLEDENLYLKKDSENSLKVFETWLEEEILEIVFDDDKFPIKKPQKIEVILHLTMNEKRLKTVDIDNLTKSVLDVMNGLVYDDDSQILNILASKDIHPLNPLNSIMIGVRKINSDNSNSWFNNITLAYFEYEEEKKDDDSVGLASSTKSS